MKKLLFICALFIGVTPMLSAQEASTTNEPTPEQYETMIENHYKVKFREMAFQSLELTEDEITKFDPLYAEYTSKKMELANKRNKLVNKYRNEMAEDDDAEEKADERADFIENYWETQIEEMELKKDYFDRFEDIVSNEKAINFFLLEEKTQSRMEESSLIGIVPMMIDVREYSPMNKDKDKKKKDSSMNLEDNEDMPEDTDAQRMANDNTAMTKTPADQKMTEKTTKTEKEWTDKSTAKTDMEKDKEWSNKTTTDKTTADKSMTDKEKTNKDWTSKGTATYTTYKSSINALSSYNDWIKNESTKVALNHKYTHNGLQKLVSAIWAVAEAHDVDASAWSDKKDRIMAITKELQKDPMSTDHADITREAFDMTTAMINAIQDKKSAENTKDVVSQVATAAQAINPDRLMTDQANDIYAFFGSANQALHALSDFDTWKNSSASTQNK